MIETLSLPQARQHWMQAQRLGEQEPFGAGPAAVRRAVEHLGYVQIDTIHVVERCHHHILFSRIPQYQREDLHHCQSVDKSLFEYWTHALAYVPTRDFRFFLPAMKKMKESPETWRGKVKPEELDRVLKLVKREGPLSIRDIREETLVEKPHPWASRKPSKKALQLGFYSGQLAIVERIGMLKKYELTKRHFGWKSWPKQASEKQVTEYLLGRALRSQGLVSLDSICYLDSNRKKTMAQLIEAMVNKKQLVEVQVQGREKVRHWIDPEKLEQKTGSMQEITHILSPFDPLVIQRKRLKLLFDYEHRFEAYIPKEKRIFGYFALPVFIGDRIVAVLDLKTDRTQKQLLIQQWSWVGLGRSATNKVKIEEALESFARFQLA